MAKEVVGVLFSLFILVSGNMASQFSFPFSYLFPIEAVEEEEQGITYIYLPAVDFMDENQFAFSGPMADYVSMTYSEFCEIHELEELYAQGIVDASTFIYNDYQFDNLVGGSTLVIDGRWEESVVGELGIGTAMESVYAQYGEPQFERGFYQLSGYKTRTFYVAFQGGETVEKIYLSRRYPLSPQEEALMIPELLTMYTDDLYYLGEDFYGFRGYQLWDSYNDFFHTSGVAFWLYWYNWSAPYLCIYNDFTGLVPKNMGENLGVSGEWMGMDYPEHKIYVACKESYQIQVKASGEKSGAYFSEDGRTALIPSEKCASFRAGFIAHDRTGERPDQYISLGYYPDEPFWIDDRHILVTFTYGAGIYDLWTGEEILYIESYGLWPEYVEQREDRFIIDCYYYAYVVYPEDLLNSDFDDWFDGEWFEMDMDEALEVRYWYDDSEQLMLELSVVYLTESA